MDYNHSVLLRETVTVNYMRILAILYIKDKNTEEKKGDFES